MSAEKIAETRHALGRCWCQYPKRTYPHHYTAPFPKEWHDSVPVRRKPAKADGGPTDVRPYLAPPAPRPGPLFQLHDFLDLLGWLLYSGQLHEPTPVRATRTRATDVVPLPAGIRGRWEGWSVEVGPPADLAKIAATERQGWIHFAEAYRKPDDTEAGRLEAHVLQQGLAIARAETRKEPRPCACGCGRIIPATARQNKETATQACRNRLSLSNKRRAA